MRNDRSDFFGTHLIKPSPLNGLTIDCTESDTIRVASILHFRYGSSANLIICTPSQYEVWTGDETVVNKEECRSRGIKIYKSNHPHAHGGFIYFPGSKRIRLNIMADHPALMGIQEVGVGIPVSDQTYVHLFRYWVDFFYNLADRIKLPLEHSHGDIFIGGNKVGNMVAARPEWSPYPVKVWGFSFTLNAGVETNMVNTLLKTVEQPVYGIEQTIAPWDILSSFIEVFGCSIRTVPLTLQDKTWLREQPERLEKIKND